MVRHMTSPVLLNQAVQAAVEDGCWLFLKVSSHPILSNSANEAIIDMDAENCAVIPTMVRNKSSTECLTKSILACYE